MVRDTRDNALPPGTPPQSRPGESLNERPYQGKIYERFPVSATPENSNALPGGTTNTAGGRPKDAGLIDAAKTVKLEELTEVHKKPCVRDSLLTGIGTSFGLEMQGMKRAAEIIDRKKTEKERKAEEARAARRKAKEEADARAEEEAIRKPQDSWKFW
ncbi:MAG: hypothetical protein LQ347_003428 [Umbilicaria vellea]|nr:MAG: hypothetical protein LQ347_003428 [Umbilicaria vellea]